MQHSIFHVRNNKNTYFAFSNKILCKLRKYEINTLIVIRTQRKTVIHTSSLEESNGLLFKVQTKP